MAIRIKRVYEAARSDDGERFLVERLWPRGVKKQNLVMRAWLKDVAPSTQLREWFGHRPERWEEFRKRYERELRVNPDSWTPLLKASTNGTVTLLYSAHDTEHNSAVLLREFLTKRKSRRIPASASKTAVLPNTRKTTRKAPPASNRIR